MSEIQQQNNPDEYQQILEVYRTCFREHAAEQGWTTEEMITKGRIGDFVRWCREHNMPARDKFAFTAAGIPEYVVDLINDEVMQADDFAALASLLPCWSSICMSGRPPLDPRPILSHISLALQFADGRAFQIQTPTQFDEGFPRTEGFVLSLLEEQFRQIIHTCKTEGLPALLEKYGQLVPEEPVATPPGPEPPSAD